MKFYTIGVGLFKLNESDPVGLIPLMLKSKPARQAGKLNFPGGKLDEGETSLDCIVREWKEETGVTIPAEDWTYIGSMVRPGDFVVNCYYTTSPELLNVETQPGEDRIIMCPSDRFLEGNFMDIGIDEIQFINNQLMPNVDAIFRFTQSEDFKNFPGLTFEFNYPAKPKDEEDYGNVTV